MDFGGIDGWTWLLRERDGGQDEREEQFVRDRDLNLG
jgi:hypothetical protein